jgi:hypothetical protein
LATASPTTTGKLLRPKKMAAEIIVFHMSCSLKIKATMAWAADIGQTTEVTLNDR